MPRCRRRPGSRSLRSPGVTQPVLIEILNFMGFVKLLEFNSGMIRDKTRDLDKKSKLFVARVSVRMKKINIECLGAGCYVRVYKP